jgi:hypothetical protein
MRAKMNESDNLRRVAAALSNLDQAFAFCFAVENSIDVATKTRLELGKIRESYMIYLDWLSKHDSHERIMDAFDDEAEFVDQYYSELISKVGLG